VPPEPGSAEALGRDRRPVPQRDRGPAAVHRPAGVAARRAGALSAGPRRCGSPRPA